jgi:hypothetical protein
MALPTATTKIIAGGAWCQVRIREASGGTLKVIGLATEASYSEDFQLQPAAVIGYLGPASIDSQGYTCSITIGTFVPENKASTGYPGAGDTTLTDLLSTRSEVQEAGKGKTFDYLDFYNTATGEVINAFSQAIISSDGSRIAPNSYVSQNITLLSIERTV